jgi:hypothetical protein
VPQQLPLIPSNPNYRMVTAVDGVQLILDLRWNGRDAAWYMDVHAEDDAETPIIHGAKLVIGALIMGRVASDLLPIGAFFVEDSSNLARDAGLDDMGERVVLLFYSAEELREAVNG